MKKVSKNLIHGEKLFYVNFCTALLCQVLKKNFQSNGDLLNNFRFKISSTNCDKQPLKL